MSSSDRDNGTEQEQLEETQKYVLCQKKEGETESLDKEATEKVLQKATDKLLLATPQFVSTDAKSCATREETLAANDVLTTANDKNEFELYDEERSTVLQVQTKNIKVQGDVELNEHVVTDDIDEEAEVQQEILLQENQTVEIVEKTVEECVVDVCVTLPQLVTLETDTLRSHREQGAYIVASPDVDDLSTLQVCRESSSEDDRITVDIITRQLRGGSSLLHLDEEIVLAIPVVAGTETAKDEDRTNVGKWEKLDENVDDSNEDGKSVFVTQAGKEIRIKREEQLGEDLDTSSQPQGQFVFTIKPAVAVSETVELPRDGASEEITSREPQLRAEEKEVKQQPAEPATTEEDPKEVGNASHEIIVIAVVEESQVIQPSIAVESMALLVHVSLPDETVITTLRPAVCEKDFTITGSKQSVSGTEKLEAGMKKDTDEHLELTTACDSEEATLEQLLKEAHDIETYKGKETMKPVIEEYTTAAVVFSSKAEHDIDLLVFQQAFDSSERIRTASDEIIATGSHFEGENVGELSEVHAAHRGKKKSESCTCIEPVVPGEAAMQHFDRPVKSETESTQFATVNEAATSALCARDKQQEVTKDFRPLCAEIQDVATEITTDEAAVVVMLAEGRVLRETEAACDSLVTIQFSLEHVPSEIEASHIVFPILSVDNSLPGAVSADEASVCDESAQEILDGDTVQFHKALETLYGLKTDSAVEGTPVMVDEKGVVHQAVQPELVVPYSSSVIVRSGDTYAQTDTIVDHLPVSLVDTSVRSSVRITEIHFSDQDELTSSLNEEECDNITAVFPENVENSLLFDQSRSSITENVIVGLPEQSSFFGSILLTADKKDNLQTDDNTEQLQNASADSTMIQMRLLDNGDTPIARPEKPECSETFSLEVKETKTVRVDDDIFEESFDKEAVVICRPLFAAGSSEIHQLKTDVQDAEIRPDIPLTSSELPYDYEKTVDIFSDRTLTDENRECAKPDECDVMQISTLQVALCDGTVVHVVREVEACDTSDVDSVQITEDDGVDTKDTKEAMKLVTTDSMGGNVCADSHENLLPASDIGLDAIQTTGSDRQILELVYVNHRSLSSLEFLEDVQTQQFEASVFTDHTETPNGKNEHEMEQRATSRETSKMTEVDREESKTANTKVCETVNIKPASGKLMTDGSQHREWESVKSEKSYTVVAQNENEAKSLVDSPWSRLFTSLLGDDSSKSVTFLDDISKGDDGSQSIEASSVEREKQVEQQIVNDDKPAESSAASKSSVITRRVQKVNADGRIVEKVKCEEVPVSFEPASLTPYFLGCDLPSPPDFSPQSEERQSSAGSIKVYTDTVEGEPWKERRVEEVEETQPDGATVTRKVVRVRKRRTIIKHIVIEGPEFEEIMTVDEAQKVAATAEASSTKIRVASDFGDFQSEEPQLELLASECRQSTVQREIVSLPRQLSVEGDIDVSSEALDVNIETDHSQSVDKLCGYETNERDDDTDKDTTSSLPLQHASVQRTVSLEFSRAPVSPPATLLGEGEYCGQSEYLSLDLDRDTSCTVGDGPCLDNAESASSCGGFATGILCYSRAGGR